MRARSSYLDFVVEQLAPLGRISARSMFGGHCLYCDGVVFALVARDTLYLKTDQVTQPHFEAAGLPPFRPFPDRPEVMRYYQAPAEFFEDGEALLRWGRAAVAVGRRARARKRRGPGKA